MGDHNEGIAVFTSDECGPSKDAAVESQVVRTGIKRTRYGNLSRAPTTDFQRVRVLDAVEGLGLS